MASIRIIEFDAEALSKGSGIPVTEVYEHFKDGRHLQPLLRKRLIHDDPWGMGWEKWDKGLIQGDDGITSLRAMTTRATFMPPYMWGVGEAHYNQGGYLDWLWTMDYFLVADAFKFPFVPVFRIGIRTVERWIREGRLMSLSHYRYTQGKKRGKLLYGRNLAPKRGSLLAELRRITPALAGLEWCYDVGGQVPPELHFDAADPEYELQQA